jgi:uncharacterized protein (DUF427 family)
MKHKHIRITHVKSGILIADGRKGWAMTPFEGNFYIHKKSLVTDGFQINYIPGLCIYKFLYIWLDFKLPDGTLLKNLGWKYWLPNPLFPFIWFRVAVSSTHPELKIEEYDSSAENQ